MAVWEGLGVAPQSPSSGGLARRGWLSSPGPEQL